MMAYFLLLALNAALLLGSDMPIPRLLSVDGKTPIQATDLPSYGNPQCDQDGDLFFHAADGSFDNPELAEITHDGHSGASFRLSPKLVKSTTFDDFFVSPDGHVYLLVQASSTDRLLLPFDKKGAPGDPIHLQTPSHLVIQNVVVFNDGSFLVRGFYNRAAGSEVKGKTYAGIYDASGQLARRLSDETTGLATISDETSKLADGAATLGEDGNLYFVNSNRVTVLSSAGAVLRRFDFPRLDSEWSITRANASKGLLALTFQRVTRKRAVEERYLVLSTLSGDVVGWYQPTDETGNINVCFKDGNEFVFMGSEGGKSYLLTAPIK